MVEPWMWAPGSVVGVFVDGPSEVLLNGRALDVGPGGWRHA